MQPWDGRTARRARSPTCLDELGQGLDGDTVQDEQPFGDSVVAIPAEMAKSAALIGRDRPFLGFHQPTASRALPKVDVWEAYRKKPA